MRIRKIEIKNFKRFTDLIITDIPEGSKLIMLIGSNGSGKSSLFDFFDWISKGPNRYFPQDDAITNLYYRKNSNQEPEGLVDIHNQKQLRKSKDNKNVDIEIIQKFIGRSSNRIVPRLNTYSEPEKIPSDFDRPWSYVDIDIRFSNDVILFIQQINNALREAVFSGKQADTLKLFHNFIEPLNNSLINIFGGNENTTIQIAEFQDASHNLPAKLIFKKGISKINYDLLSHGEKQVIILLINFIVRQPYYKNAIIFIDEMDCHLNTALQSSLIREIVSKWIPDDAQLWTASHALGFIEYANSSEHSSTIDFDLLDFDSPQILTPSPKEQLDVFDIALPKALLFEIMKDKKIIICENKNDEYYNLLGISDTLFVGVRDSRDVFLNVKRDNRYHSLRDRDFLSDNEILKLKKEYPNHNILFYYDFENYLYHPDNIESLNPIGFNKPEFIKEIIKQKTEKYDYILPTIISSRQSYEEFKTNDKLRDTKVDGIVDDFKSNDFERFYKYFDMKEQFNKYSLSILNLKKEDLVKTSWFKKKIKELIS